MTKAVDSYFLFGLLKVHCLFASFPLVLELLGGNRSTRLFIPSLSGLVVRNLRLSVLTSRAQPGGVLKSPSTVTESQPDGLLFLHVQKELTDELDVNAVLKRFCFGSER